MHEVRVYKNHDDGTLWWAEDDLGFTGGADRLSDLVTSIHEWAEAEGLLPDLAVRLVGAEPLAPVWDPIERSHAPAGPQANGTEAVRIEFSPVGV
jgi:hypothetical protein